MVDWILAPGGLVLIVIGLVALFRPDWLWRLYSLESRWRKDHPEQPEDWAIRARRQSYVFMVFGLLVLVLSIVLVNG